MRSQYVPMPRFIQDTPRGRMEWDPYSRLANDRIIFLGTPVDDTVTDQPAKKPPKDLKAFMEANKLRLDQVVFYIQKVRRTEKKSTNESMNVDYFVSFSEKLWITDAVDVTAIDRRSSNIGFTFAKNAS